VPEGVDVDYAPLIAECYFYAKPINGHLSYPAVAEHVHVAGARRVILTHRAARCWLAGAASPGECGPAGLVIEV
jgi:ribonuclease BN (tRNA processing enzyme)